jgi:DNA gyrase/topoisomerase IV subunit A
MSELSIITAVAICICGAFITGSVAFVIKSIMNDIAQAEATSDKAVQFIRSEILGLRKSLDAFKTEERHKDDELKVSVEKAQDTLRVELKEDRKYQESIKGELKKEMMQYWDKAENVLEARRQDIYMLHKKIDEAKEYVIQKIEKT